MSDEQRKDEDVEVEGHVRSNKASDEHADENENGDEVEAHVRHGNVRHDNVRHA
jgi:hypothetical protein